MRNLIIGIAIGVVVATVGLSGLVKAGDKLLNTAKDSISNTVKE